MTRVRHYWLGRSTVAFSFPPIDVSEGISKGVTYRTGLLLRSGNWYLILGQAVYYYSGMADLTNGFLSMVPLRLCICL